MKKIMLPLFAMIVYSTIMCAQSRNEQEALDMAQTFFRQNSALARSAKQIQKPTLTIVPQKVIQEQIKKGLDAPKEGFAKKTGFYIVNDETNHRFVIVSADNQQLDILGYSDNGEFDTNNIPCGLLTLLEQFNREYEYIQNGGSIQSRANKTRATKAVAPLIKTNWDQGNNDINNVGEYVFNKYCPTDPSTGERSVTGCVATAMAQILNYYKMPKNLSDSVISYTTEKKGIVLNERLSNYQIDWNNMADWYKDKRTGYPSTTPAQRDAVGRLMYLCGLSVRMDYGSSSSSSSTYDAPYALKKFFRYNPNLSYRIKDYYTDDEWVEMIQTELNEGRPIIYAGRNEDDSGHTFLLVGCDDSDRYCFNFGWGGNHNDEYFSLSSITPKGHDYSYKQSMIIGISSNTVDTKQDVWYADLFSMSNTTITLGGNATATLTKPTCFCSDANSFNTPWFGEIGVGVYDTNFGLISEYKILDTNLKIYYWYESIQKTIKFDASIFKEGEQYIIAPYAKGTNSSVSTRMRTFNAASDYYVATVKDGIVTLELMGATTGNEGGGGDTTQNTPKMAIVSTTFDPDTANFKKLTKYDILAFDATIKNTGTSGKIRTCLAVWDDTKTYVYGTEDYRDFATNATHTIHYEVPLTFVPEGKYKVGIIYYNYWISKKWWNYFDNKNVYDITINKASGIPVSKVSLNRTSVTLNPNDTYQLKATISPYNAQEKSVTWKSSNTSVATVNSSGLITAKAAGNDTITCVSNDGSGKSAICIVQVLPSGSPKISWVSVTTSTDNLSNLTPQNTLKFRATFKNTGAAAMISTSPAIYLMNENSTVSQRLRGTEDYRLFPANTETTIDYELPLTKCPDGEFVATVTYFCNWGGKYTNYYNSSYLIDINVSSGKHEIKILSIDCDSTNFKNLTQNDILRYHATFRNTGQEERIKSIIGLIPEETGYIDYMSFADERTFPLNEDIEIDYAFPLTSVPPGTYTVGVMFNKPWVASSTWGWTDRAFLRTIEIKEGDTAINPVYTKVDDESQAVYYDLQGRRVDKPTKRGLYIRNGKKVLIK
jgi:uncharacterized protein YjdB